MITPLAVELVVHAMLAMITPLTWNLCDGDAIVLLVVEVAGVAEIVTDLIEADAAGTEFTRRIRFSAMLTTPLAPNRTSGLFP